MLRNCLQLQHEATNAALALLIGHLACSCGHIQTLLTSMHDVLASEVDLQTVRGAQKDSCTVDICSDESAGCVMRAGHERSSSEDMDVERKRVDAPPGVQGSYGALELLVHSSETSCLLHLLTHEVAVSPAVLLASDGAAAPAVLEGLVGLLHASLVACIDEKEHLQARDAGSCREELEDRIGRGCRCCAALVLEACLRVCPRSPLLTLQLDHHLRHT